MVLIFIEFYGIIKNNEETVRYRTEGRIFQEQIKWWTDKTYE